MNTKSHLNAELNSDLKSRVGIRKLSTRDRAALAKAALETGPQVRIVEKSVKCGMTSRDETDSLIESLQNPNRSLLSSWTEQ
jgi:hypothetical protein